MAAAQPRDTVRDAGFHAGRSVGLDSMVQMTYGAPHPRTNPCLDATTTGHKLVTSTVQVIENEITAGADGVHTGGSRWSIYGWQPDPC
jgi:hypothetical protein